MGEIDLSHPMNVCRASAGTGKTFTLAACYVGLLLSGESYRNILAVTFTNKATAEMKERILSYLHAIAEGREKDFFEKARSFMIARQGDSDAQLRQRAGECFRQMLSDYDNVQVSTIDSFLQVLLSGMAQMLGKGAGYKIELNVRQVITEAVDRMLTTEMDAQMEKILEEYMVEQLADEARWDIRQQLIQLASNLYDEAAQILRSEGKIELDPEVIRRYKKHLDQWRQRPEMVDLERRRKELAEKASSDDTLRKTVDKMLTNIDASLHNTKDVKTADLFRGLTSAAKRDCLETKTEAWEKKLGSAIYKEVCALQIQCDRCCAIYWECELTSRCLQDMRLMKGLLEQIDRQLQEANCTLLAETANKLSQALKPGDADFILEKAGIRYKHIMIDEFQDTSQLQWKVFLPLLQEVLATQGHSLLIVGDIKQSIYRWRNGDWHIMHGLGTSDDPLQTHWNADFKPLVRNFRSRRNVVEFNLETMRRVVADEAAKGLYDEGFDGANIGQFYNTKDGGFVRLRVYPKKGQAKKDQALASVNVREKIIQDMFATIDELVGRGEPLSNIMILVRSNREARKVVDYFQTIAGQAEQYPHLQGARLVSNDSFHLDQSPSVVLAVKALEYIETGDAVALEYIRLVKKQEREDIEETLGRLDRQLPLYEMLQELVRILECDAEGMFMGSDVAYMNCLMDKVRDFVANNGSDRRAFLQYWSDRMHGESIPAPDTDAIRIMTVHSSKGLESKTLFIPFCTWPMEDTGSPQRKNKMWCRSARPTDPEVTPLRQVPIEDNKKLEGTCYEDDYKAEHADLRIDSLNILYVALTRAANNLYIYADLAVKSSKGMEISPDNVGAMLMYAYGLRDETIEAYKENDSKMVDEALCYAEYVHGDAPYIEPLKAKTAGDDPFSFRGAEAIEATLRSDSRQVRFRQSQESAMYTVLHGGAEEVLDQINAGNVCHDILARVETREDLPRVVDEFYRRGIIASEAQREEIRGRLDGAWKNEQLCDWFSGRWELLREQTILIDGHEVRPDRVMTRNGEAVVLDYKFGKPQAKYKEQVHGYMAAMRALGYEQVRGYLWYAKEQRLEEVQ